MKKADPRLMLIMSMTVFGTLGLFVRNIPVSSGELALYRAVLAALLIGVYLLVSRQKIPFARIKKEVPLLLLSGAAMGVNWILLFEAYRYTSVSVATLSYYFAPVIVTLVCPILFHEKLTGKKFLCFVMSTLGLVLITGIGDTRGSDDLKGILFGLAPRCFMPPSSCSTSPSIRSRASTARFCSFCPPSSCSSPTCSRQMASHSAA